MGNHHSKNPPKPKHWHPPVPEPPKFKSITSFAQSVGKGVNKTLDIGLQGSSVVGNGLILAGAASGQIEIAGAGGALLAGAELVKQGRDLGRGQRQNDQKIRR